MWKLIKMIGKKWRNNKGLKRELYCNMIKIKIIVIGPSFIKGKYLALKICIIIKFIGYRHQLLYKCILIKQIRNQVLKTRNKTSKTYHYYYYKFLINYSQYRRTHPPKNNKTGSYSQHHNATNVNINKSININMSVEVKSNLNQLKLLRNQILISWA